MRKENNFLQRLLIKASDEHCFFASAKDEQAVVAFEGSCSSHNKNEQGLSAIDIAQQTPNYFPEFLEAYRSKNEIKG